jgi:type I restriction enzyme S subunit
MPQTNAPAVASGDQIHTSQAPRGARSATGPVVQKKRRVKLVDGPGIVVGRKGNVGSVFWVDEAFWPIDTVYYVEPEKVSLFVLHLLQAQTYHNSDAAVPGLNRDYAYSIKITWPKQSLRDEFETFAQSIFAQRKILLAANLKLTAARDLLLPRLMDGRISI